MSSHPPSTKGLIYLLFVTLTIRLSIVVMVVSVLLLGLLLPHLTWLRRTDGGCPARWRWSALVFWSPAPSLGIAQFSDSTMVGKGDI